MILSISTAVLDEYQSESDTTIFTRVLRYEIHRIGDFERAIANVWSCDVAPLIADAAVDLVTVSSELCPLLGLVDDSRRAALFWRSDPNIPSSALFLLESQSVEVVIDYLRMSSVQFL